MEDYIDEFIEYLKNVKKTSDNTADNYRRDLLRMAAYVKERGISDVGSITEDVVLDYTASLKEEHFAASSITRHNTSIKSFFRYLLESGYTKDNPAENIKSPKVEKKKTRVLSAVEIDSLLSQDFGAEAKGLRDRAILELMYSTGLKTSEVIGLKLVNIDIALGCVRVKAGNDSSRDRLIPYGNKARDAIDKYLVDGRNVLLEGKFDDGTLFPSCNGEKMSRQGLWKLIKTYVKKAGIRADVTPVTLRHSFAVNMIENGADAASLQELMGYTGGSSISRYIEKGEKGKDPYGWARIRN